MRVRHEIAGRKKNAKGVVLDIKKIFHSPDWFERLLGWKPYEESFQVFYPISQYGIPHTASISFYPSGESVPLSLWSTIKNLIEIQDFENESSE